MDQLLIKNKKRYHQHGLPHITSYLHYNFRFGNILIKKHNISVKTDFEGKN